MPRFLRKIWIYLRYRWRHRLTIVLKSGRIIRLSYVAEAKFSDERWSIMMMDGFAPCPIRKLSPADIELVAWGRFCTYNIPE